MMSDYYYYLFHPMMLGLKMYNLSYFFLVFIHLSTQQPYKNHSVKHDVMMGYIEGPFLKYLLGFSFYVEPHTTCK